MEIKKVTKKGQEYLCDIDLTVEDWKRILQDENFGKYIDTLIEFYSEPNHKSTCKALGDKYNVSPQSFSGIITNFAKAVQKKLNRFKIIGTDGKPTYWIIPMKGKHVGEYFEWTIRPELVQAMKELNLKGKHLLQKIYDEAIENKHRVFYDWFPSYKKSVQEYKEQAINNNWTDTVFQKLVKDTTKNGISDLQQGNFTWEEFEKIKSNWSEIQPVIKEVAEKNQISKTQYKEIVSFFGKQTTGNRPSGTNRVVAAFLPNIVTTVVNYRYLREVIAKLKNRFPDYPKIQEEWLIDNFNFIKYCNSNVDFKDIWHSSVFAWYLKEYFENERLLIQKNEASMQKYIDLLLNNKNLILTGAPGTGKTYLAKEIAKQMIGVKTDEELEECAQFNFVQFHPSYDYTDFVEGLRPTEPDENGNIGFKLIDGVFKEFCKKASGEFTQLNIDDAIDKFIDEERFSSNNGTKTPFTTESKTKFTVTINDKDTIRIDAKKEGGDAGTISKPSLIKCINGNGTRLYDKVVAEYIKTKYLSTTSSFTSKDCVFIIDEINRGEISKIFGELFFSIDPSYRGKKGAVKTQYSNLHNDEKEVFYVPENVYIIGSMNDIDRSVESFDFAMRRRFTWIEITAEQSAENMNLPQDIKERMLRLNEQISKTDGLNPSYHIGAAYFLDSNGSPRQDTDIIWNLRIEPLLKEYLRGMPDTIEKIELLKNAFIA